MAVRQAERGDPLCKRIDDWMDPLQPAVRVTVSCLQKMLLRLDERAPSSSNKSTAVHCLSYDCVVDNVRRDLDNLEHGIGLIIRYRKTNLWCVVASPAKKTISRACNALQLDVMCIHGLLQPWEIDPDEHSRLVEEIAGDFGLYEAQYQAGVDEAATMFHQGEKSSIAQRLEPTDASGTYKTYERHHTNGALLKLGEVVAGKDSLSPSLLATLNTRFSEILVALMQHYNVLLNDFAGIKTDIYAHARLVGGHTALRGLAEEMELLPERCMKLVYTATECLVSLDIALEQCTLTSKWAMSDGPTGAEHTASLIRTIPAVLQTSGTNIKAFFADLTEMKTITKRIDSLLANVALPDVSPIFGPFSQAVTTVLNEVSKIENVVNSELSHVTVLRYTGLEPGVVDGADRNTQEVRARRLSGRQSTRQSHDADVVDAATSQDSAEFLVDDAIGADEATGLVTVLKSNLLKKVMTMHMAHVSSVRHVVLQLPQSLSQLASSFELVKASLETDVTKLLSASSEVEGRLMGKLNQGSDGGDEVDGTKGNASEGAEDALLTSINKINDHAAASKKEKCVITDTKMGATLLSTIVRECQSIRLDARGVVRLACRGGATRDEMQGVELRIEALNEVIDELGKKLYASEGARKKKMMKRELEKEREREKQRPSGGAAPHAEELGKSPSPSMPPE